MELQELIGFIAVARTGSFSAAAKKTFRTQPAVSLQVKRLEEEFDAKFFERLGTKKVLLTEEGKAILELVEPLVDGFDCLKQRFHERRADAAVTLQIAAHASVMVHFLPKVLKRFLKRYPGAKVTILSRGRSDILEMVKSREVDFGITSLSGIPPWAEAIVFARSPRVLVTPKKHPLAKAKTVRLAALTKYPLILPPPGSNTRAVIDAALAENNLSYPLAMEVTGRDAIKAYVQAGLGVSIMSAFYLTAQDRMHLAVRDLTNIFGNSESERAIVFRKGQYLSLAAKYFIALLTSRHRN